jgi:hypothetical protein
MRSTPANPSSATRETTQPLAKSLARMIRRLGSRSTIAPPRSRKTSIVPVFMAAPSPSCSGDPPSARIWKGTATV